MNELSLFTGIGGGLLGTHLLGWTPIGYVEINEYCQRVIAQRIEDGIFPRAPIFTDVREFVQSGAADQYRGFADVVTAGFPCQPFSVAGRRRGADDERNMWPATMEIIRRVQPTWAFLENVPGLLSSGYFGTILDDLSQSGFDVGWRILSAAEVGAPHLRKRLWIVAHSTSKQDDRRGRSNVAQKAGSGQGVHTTTDIGGQDVPHPNGRRCEQCDSEKRAVSIIDACDLEVPYTKSGERYTCWRHGTLANATRNGIRSESWVTEPELGRLANGIPNRVDRLRANGNGQVPAVVAAAWHLLTER